MAHIPHQGTPLGGTKRAQDHALLRHWSRAVPPQRLHISVCDAYAGKIRISAQSSPNGKCKGALARELITMITRICALSWEVIGSTTSNLFKHNSRPVNCPVRAKRWRGRRRCGRRAACLHAAKVCRCAPARESSAIVPSSSACWNFIVKRA